MLNKNNLINLFNSLEKGVSEIDLNNIEKNDLIENIKNLDNKGLEITIILIKLYEKSKNINDYISIPYKGKQQKNGIKFELDNLPFKCKQIINKFIKFHIISMENDKHRNNVNL